MEKINKKYIEELRKSVWFSGRLKIDEVLENYLISKYGDGPGNTADTWYDEESEYRMILDEIKGYNLIKWWRKEEKEYPWL